MVIISKYKIKDLASAVKKNNTVVFNQTVFLFFILSFISQTIKAQFYNLPSEFFSNTLSQRHLATVDSAEQIHSSVQPYIPFFNKKYNYVGDTFRVFKFIKDDKGIDKVFLDHLIHIKSKQAGKFDFRIDPLLNLENGRAEYDTTKTQKISTNTRGFIASGSIGKDFYFETMFSENQSFFPHYIQDLSNATKIIPGQGRYKVFKTTGYDYAFSSGFFSYQPSKNVNIQLGHGKQKIGNGYRSLLLSDNAFNYPYARFTSQWFKGKLQYTNLYAALMNLTTGGAKTPKNTESLFQKKAFAMQYLSLNISKHLNVSLYQGMIWNAADSSNKQHLEWQYFNPVIFTNLASYGLNHKNNILIGANANYKISSKLNLYGQFMADDLSNKTSLGNAIGYQLGLNYYDAFKVKHLTLLAEYNDVAEGSYNSPFGTTSNQSYSHYNQSLAYTPGYGKEIVLLADYKFRRLFVNAKYNKQFITFNKADLYYLDFSKIQLGYTINPAYNFNVSLSYNTRVQDFLGFNKSNNTTTFYTLSIKTNLYNTYFDF